ncbi:hypothetical protein KSP40_PGU001013 [Platanthera guangdongensis]|uniref:Uncharacterized protein n=1 Tax=Platanthera guangdongensis TaxID=2320717 RepID=A0ABR2LWH2_9ASPA
MVDDEFLEHLNLVKGTRKVINNEKRGRMLRAMDGCNYKATTGISLSNMYVSLAELGHRSINDPRLNNFMARSVGSDPR